MFLGLSSVPKKIVPWEEGLWVHASFPKFFLRPEYMVADTTMTSLVKLSPEFRSQVEHCCAEYLQLNISATSAELQRLWALRSPLQEALHVHLSCDHSQAGVPSARLAVHHQCKPGDLPVDLCLVTWLCMPRKDISNRRLDKFCLLCLLAFPSQLHSLLIWQQSWF